MNTKMNHADFLRTSRIIKAAKELNDEKIACFWITMSFQERALFRSLFLFVKSIEQARSERYVALPHKEGHAVVDTWYGPVGIGKILYAGPSKEWATREASKMNINARYALDARCRK